MRIKLLLICLLTAALLSLIPTYLTSRREDAGTADIGRDVPDYFKYDESDPGLGPRIGEGIDLSGFRSRDGVTLANSISGQLAMLGTVDPACGACEVASDEMRYVRNRVVPAGVQYYLVSFAKSPPDFFKYADNLDVQAPAFLWNAKEKLPPESLYLMVLPSHILIDRNGTVIRKWPGTDNQKSVRHKMAAQIVRDALNEISLSTRAVTRLREKTSVTTQ